MPEPRSEELTELTKLIGGLVARLHQGIKTDSFDLLVRLDLTLTQLRVIVGLGDTGSPQAISDIADTLGVSLATAGRSVDQLVHAGLAKRREDPDDRRSRLVSLSDEGRALLEVHRSSRDAHIRAFADALPTDVAGPLTTALRQALASVGDPSTTGGCPSLDDSTPTDDSPAGVPSTDDSTDPTL